MFNDIYFIFSIISLKSIQHQVSYSCSGGPAGKKLNITGPNVSIQNFCTINSACLVILAAAGSEIFLTDEIL